MDAPLILLDLPPEQEREVLAPDLVARLAALGRVERGRTEAWSGDERMSADIVVTGWGSDRFPEGRAPGDRLRLVAHSAGTIRPIVPRALIDDGVVVCQASEGMATSVAELALFFSISLLRNLHGVDRSMCARDWSAASRFGLGSTIDSARIVVLGASRVGRRYIALANALGAEVVVYDPFLATSEADAMGVRLDQDLDHALASGELIAVHVPVTTETTGFLTAERLALIPDGTPLVNTARSAVLDSVALERELVSGRLSAALDVFDLEPLPQESRLWELPNVILTPHLGAVTRQSRRQQGVATVEDIERFARGERPIGAVTSAAYEHLA